MIRGCLGAIARYWRRVRCFWLPHDFGKWGEGLPPDFDSSKRYFQHRGCLRCGLIKERMIW